MYDEVYKLDLPGKLLELGIVQRKPGISAKRGRDYISCLTAFDIESSTVIDSEGEPHSFMYVWQWRFHELGITVVGRRWSEFLDLMEDLQSVMSEKMWLVVLVHNLSYEVQFLEGIYPFTSDDLFCLKSRTVLRADMFSHFELRCSYRHSNMSLAKYLEKFNVEHKKLSGEEFNYKKLRYPWTELTERELEYAENDVLGLCEAYSEEMRLNGDDLYTVPSTSTGYVRREIKQAMKPKYTYLKYQQPDPHLYELLTKAFRGGDTHANRFYSGIVLHDVRSFDRSSSYPDVIVNCEFPTTKFQPVRFFDKFDILEASYHGRASVFTIRFTNIRLRNEYFANPYLSYSKCRILTTREVKREKKISIEEDVDKDNGRVLRAGALETCLTDVDYRIVNEVYCWDCCEILDLYTARYDYLPKEYTDLVKSYYIGKTSLKGVEGKEFFYDKSKALLNALYGCMAQNAVKDEIKFVNGEYVTETVKPAEALEKFYRQPYCMYQWGVWVTAWARYRLFEMQKLCGRKLVYWDTDSVKFVGDVDFSGYNRIRMRDSKKHGAFADDPKGTRHFMGVAEPDAEYKLFKTLGAKKYVYEDEKGVHVTIAGVDKKKGGRELEKLGGVAAFKEGLIFREAGGVDLVYNDDDNFLWKTPEGNVMITRNVSIVESEYTVGVTWDYGNLLLMLAGLSFDMDEQDFDISEFDIDNYQEL